MKSGGPLKRGGRLTRKTPLRARKQLFGADVPIARVRQTQRTHKRSQPEFWTWQQLRAWVFERDGGRCVRCGRGLSGHWECHHRRLRSQGGQDVLSNLIALCNPGGCHEWVHLNREAAQLHGWICVSAVGPLVMPVTYWDRECRTLLDDGGYHGRPLAA
jgi:5-methylcytosine-specific restriction endonuclease McrA